ncbi:hypothetical protein [Hymenobacter antarcticus]|uniref:hypothetical protein n=1 Tax=Hymenobacter antarcticus TaxID=486270 RepID=UPI0031EACC21
MSENDEPFYSEGFPVRFYKPDGTDWVANFRLGWTGLNKVFEFNGHDKIIVVAGGLGYIMTPEKEKPLSTFGLTINEIFQTDNGSLVCADGISILILDNLTGELWSSERISWDGFQNLELNDNIISGQAFDPTNSINEWSAFFLNIKTKELIGGSYREFTKFNPEIPKVILEDENKIRPWWKIF